MNIYLRCLQNTKGSVLIGVIAGMMVLAAIGTALVSMTSTTDLAPVVANRHQRAFYLAESGYRFAASVFLHAGDNMTGDAASDARDDSLTAMHNNHTYQLPGGGEFDLVFRSYYYNTSAAVPAGGNLTATPFGELPNFTVSINQPGYLKIGKTRYDYQYTGVSVSGNSLVFQGLNDAVDAGRKRVFPVCRTLAGTVADGGDVVCQNNSGEHLFPPRNAYFTINNDSNTVYRYRTFDPATNTFSGIHDVTGAPVNLVLNDGDSVVGQRFTHFLSTGRVGSGDSEVNRDVDYFLALVAEPPFSGVLDEIEDPVDDTFNHPGEEDDLPDQWTDHSGGGDPWGEAELEDGALEMEDEGPGEGNEPKGAIVGLDVDYFQNAWTKSSHYLSYDVQVKMKADVDSEHPDDDDCDGHHGPDDGDCVDDEAGNYYLGGIAFRLNNVGTGNMRYLGVSYVRTRQQEGHGAHAEDDGIKDEFAVAEDTHMLILWKLGNGNNSEEVLAYKTLDANDRLVDGEEQLVDWTTMLVRVREQVAQGGPFAGQRVNDIRVYYADPQGGGTPDASPLNNDRHGYPRDEPPSEPPVRNWPVDDVGYWAAENDYFTLVTGWTLVEDGSLALTGTGVESDGVLRSNDGDFLTDFQAWPDGRPEVGLHMYGVTDILFDDFSVRFPGTGAGSPLPPGFREPIQQ